MDERAMALVKKVQPKYGHVPLKSLRLLYWQKYTFAVIEGEDGQKAIGFTECGRKDFAKGFDKKKGRTVAIGRAMHCLVNGNNGNKVWAYPFREFREIVSYIQMLLLSLPTEVLERLFSKPKDATMDHGKETGQRVRMPGLRKEAKDQAVRSQTQ